LRRHCPGNPLLGGIQAAGNSNAIRGMAAAAPSRCDRANDARLGSGTALERRPGILPRAKR
jgi:hypothetical protein